MTAEFDQLPVIGGNQGREEDQGSGSLFSLGSNNGSHGCISSSKFDSEELVRSSEMMLTSEVSTARIYHVNILITSKSILGMLRILSDSLCSVEKRITGIAAISKVLGTFEMRLSLESTLVVLLSLKRYS